MATPVAAHPPALTGLASTPWSAEPAILTPLVLAGALYALGVARLWASTRIGAGVRIRHAVLYALGWAALVVALLSPLHPLGEVLFSAHMVQHEVLMVIAAPLLVLGSPLLAYAWALPRSVVAVAGRIGRKPPLRAAWRVATLPLVACAVHAVALWGWHVPSLFEATLDSDAIHALQHLSFLGSALLFWWALLRGRDGIAVGGAVLYLFATSAQTGLLGALLTFAPHVWYPAYTATAPQWGLTPIEDQELGGLIMWVPASLVYVIAALALMSRWLRSAEHPSRFAAASIERRGSAVIRADTLAPRVFALPRQEQT